MPGGYPPSSAGYPPPTGYPSTDAGQHRAEPEHHQPEPEYHPPTPFQLALPDLRNRIVNRLLDATFLHVQQAWARRRNDPISPHALLLFFAEPPVDEGRVAYCQLRVARRPFFADDEAHLPLLLYQMADIIDGHMRAGHRPQDKPITNRADPMSSAAFYVGLGVSSLDTPTGLWSQVQRTAFTEVDVASRCRAELTDGTRLRVDVRDRQRFRAVEVLANATIRDGSRLGERRWEYDEERVLTEPLKHGADEHQRTYEHDTWQWLSHLNNTIKERLEGRRA